ncbi:MAG: DUF4365 domain-containing protein [Synergistaceae bacterium]|nr:DUF4365 domain-containing protein [Synergistaceae bacterium]
MKNLIFRTQREGSTGLNAHLEITGENPRVVGLRVCTSEEADKSARGYIIRGDTEIAAYWLQHSLPVVIMVYEHERNKIFWESVSTENLEIAGRKWEIIIPYENEYNDEAARRIANLTCTSPYLARLALDKALIELISTGREIFLELDEWINQPSSRGNLRICIPGPDGGVYQWPFETSPDVPQVLSLPGLFPWASMSIDEEFYSAKNFHDFDTNTLAPYVIESGEIARFRFKLELNSLGKSFLAAEPYICRGIFPSSNQNISYGNEYESGLKFQLYKRV